MKTNVEKHVAVFDQVLGHCNALGGMYNPSTDSLKVAAMTSMLTSAREIIKAADTAKSDYITAINRRQTAFRNVAGIATRILNAVQVTKASPSLVADIKLYRDKFSSPKRAKETPEDSSKSQTSPPARPSRGALSELDFESKVRNFGIIIELLKKESSYAPNEAEISIEGLTVYHTSLQGANDAVRVAKVNLRNARIARNETMNGPSGIRKTTSAVKKYILSAFGFKSDVYQNFRSLTIKNL